MSMEARRVAMGEKITSEDIVVKVQELKEEIKKWAWIDIQTIHRFMLMATIVHEKAKLVAIDRFTENIVNEKDGNIKTFSSSLEALQYFREIYQTSPDEEDVEYDIVKKKTKPDGKEVE